MPIDWICVASEHMSEYCELGDRRIFPKEMQYLKGEIRFFNGREFCTHQNDRQVGEGLMLPMQTTGVLRRRVNRSWNGARKFQKFFAEAMGSQKKLFLLGPSLEDRLSGFSFFCTEIRTFGGIARILVVPFTLSRAAPNWRSGLAPSGI